MKELGPVIPMRNPKATALSAALLISISLISTNCTAPGDGLPGAAGAAGDQDLISAFRELHSPIYRVYSLGPDPDAVHDLLSASFAGRALTREYVEHYSTLVWMQKEQTAIDVLQVNYEQVDVLRRERGSVEIDADWSVGGVVTHRNHQHARVNRYRAVYTLASIDGGLRIVETRVRNSERVGSLLSADGSWVFDALPSSGSGFMDPAELLGAGIGAEEDPVPEGEAP